LTTEPTNDTTAQPGAESPQVVTDQPELAQPPVPDVPDPVVPGERLGMPQGATPVIADYGRPAPSYVFLALVSVITLAADIGSKNWAATHLEGYPGAVEVWKNHLTLILAKNRGGAWGLLQSTSENVRRPFFLLVSVAAIAFIMTLYRRLQPRQHALKWGLPLVLGGALGNVFDRIRFGHVIDFIDAHAVIKFSQMGAVGHWLSRTLGMTDGEHHWPTFNVADIAICVGVGLMAVDMFTSKRGRMPILRAPDFSPAQSGEPSPDWNGAPPGDPPLDSVDAPTEPPAADAPVLPEQPSPEAASKE
jgi:signal peptidase II